MPIMSEERKAKLIDRAEAEVDRLTTRGKRLRDQLTDNVGKLAEAERELRWLRGEPEPTEAVDTNPGEQ